MKVITKDSLLKTLPKRWKQSYPKDTNLFQGSSDVVYRKLLKAKTEKEANDIIGNISWMINTCDECGNDCKKIIQFGGDDDFDCAPTNVCPDCINKAVSLIKK